MQGCVRRGGCFEGDGEELWYLGLDGEFDGFVGGPGLAQQAGEGGFDVAMEENAADGVAELVEFALALDAEGGGAFVACTGKASVLKARVREVEVVAEADGALVGDRVAFGEFSGDGELRGLGLAQMDGETSGAGGGGWRWAERRLGRTAEDGVDQLVELVGGETASRPEQRRDGRVGVQPDQRMTGFPILDCVSTVNALISGLDPLAGLDLAGEEDEADVAGGEAAIDRRDEVVSGVDLHPDRARRPIPASRSWRASLADARLVDGAVRLQKTFGMFRAGREVLYAGL